MTPCVVGLFLREWGKSVPFNLAYHFRFFEILNSAKVNAFKVHFFTLEKHFLTLKIFLIKFY